MANNATKMILQNLTHRVKTTICIISVFSSTLFISSCQKENTQTTNINAPNINNLSPLATAAKPPKYKLTAPIYLINASNIVITGDSINGGSNVGITLINCTNIHITKSKIMNAPAQRGIWVSNCTNVLIDSCYISNVGTGVYAHDSRQVRVLSNQFLNMKATWGNFVEFDNVSGGYNRINYNKCENVKGVANPSIGDGINLYKSNGLPTDPIYVLGNWIRGGGQTTGGSGMSGIVAGDLGGSYQDFEDNILVNTGYVGLQVQGGTHITVKNNKIYSDLVPWSGLGLGSANYSTSPSNSNIITGNQVNWHAGYLNMKQRDTSYKAANNNAMPTGWKNNTVKSAVITANILPAVIIKQPY